MYQGPTPTKFGQYQAAAPRQLHRLHIPAGTPLREVQHHVPLPVLDQEDLEAQGINTSILVPGSARVDALGSCTCNAGTAHLAERLAAASRGSAIIRDTLGYATLTPGTTDAVTAERFAIILYHLVTAQTGNPATEWPPTDCGSSGYYVCAELERQRAATSYRTAAGARGALSLLQDGTVMQGMPWFHAWMQPDRDGFVDGDGSPEALRAAISSGVAGGHETLQTGIPQLAVTAAGTIDLANTVVRCRNSWSANWNPPLGGDFLLHASTLDMLAAYADFKQAVI